MNRNHLAIFHAVAEGESFSKGAERLMVSQPAVSKQVRELERSLGTPLFDRLPKGIRLTGAGEVLAGYARRMAAVEDEAGRAMAELRGLRRGRLAVGASLTIGTYLLPELLGAFRRRWPDVELRAEIGNTRHVRRLLAEGVLDVALIEGPPDPAFDLDLDRKVFQEDELVAVAPPGHPLLRRPRVTAKVFCREPLILREEGSGTRAVVEQALARKGVTAAPAFVLATNEAVNRARRRRAGRGHRFEAGGRAGGRGRPAGGGAAGRLVRPPAPPPAAPQGPPHQRGDGRVPLARREAALRQLTTLKNSQELPTKLRE